MLNLLRKRNFSIQNTNTTLKQNTTVIYRLFPMQLLVFYQLSLVLEESSRQIKLTHRQAYDSIKKPEAKLKLAMLL
ncbi:MAG: hypothetical protein MJ223_02905 [Mycoplasmoidaceae bacterium]|nr:hypothetical protein [Mycoplasmoidaceae bacterium]